MTDANENVGLASNANEALARALGHPTITLCAEDCPIRYAGPHYPHPEPGDPIYMLMAPPWVRPIEQAGSLPASGEALNSPKGSQVGAETPRAAVHAGLDTPGTHGGSVKPAIEQAAEERSSESGDPDTRGRASGFAPSSAAVAPLEPIPTDWGVGPLTRKRGGA